MIMTPYRAIKDRTLFFFWKKTFHKENSFSFYEYFFKGFTAANPTIFKDFCLFLITFYLKYHKTGKTCLSAQIDLSQSCVKNVNQNQILKENTIEIV